MFIHIYITREQQGTEGKSYEYEIQIETNIISNISTKFTYQDLSDFLYSNRFCSGTFRTRHPYFATGFCKVREIHGLEDTIIYPNAGLGADSTGTFVLTAFGFVQKIGTKSSDVLQDKVIPM